MFQFHSAQLNSDKITKTALNSGKRRQKISAAKLKEDIIEKRLIAQA